MRPKMPSEERRCSYCKNIFIAKVYSNKKLCSRECVRLAKIGVPLVLKPRKQVICLGCGKVMNVLYPDVKLKIIDGGAYKDLKSKFENLINAWE
jgi:hypothetical protein